MDCILIESESYEELKQKYDDLQSVNTILEIKNESLLNCNQLLKRLVNALENIKFNFEQKVLLMKSGYDIKENFQPFDKDLNVWDEEYCHLKCLFTEYEFNKNDVNYESSNSYNNNEYSVHEESNDNESQENSLIVSYNQLNTNCVNNDQSVKKVVKRKAKAQNCNEKRFKCEWNDCHYRTDIKGNYVKHYRIHTGEKPFKCDFNGCQYCCSDPTQYRDHKKSHSKARKFTCDWLNCDLKFKTIKNLRNHKRACHTGDKPHKCEWPGCDKAFMSPFELSYHKRSHTGDRPFICDFPECKQTFTRSATLLRHKRASHGVKKQFICDVIDCESKFTRKDDLIRHIRVKHESSFEDSVINKKKDKKKNTNFVKRKKRLKFVSNNDCLLTDNKIVIDLNKVKNENLKYRHI